MFRSTRAALLLFVLALAGSAWAETKAPLGYGRTASPAEIAGWDIDVDARGRGLPPGKGSVKDGEDLFITHCSSCHGVFGEGAGRFPELAGGRGTLATDNPRKTVGSFWPYATTLFDYVRRAKPFPAPQTLSNDEVYAVVAYLLWLNEIVKEDTALDAVSLPMIVMPNAGGFDDGRDPRPDVANALCMKNCRSAPPNVTSDLARNLGVTPSRKAD